MQTDHVDGPGFVPPSNDDGYISPDLNLPSEDEDEEDKSVAKRSKLFHQENTGKSSLLTLSGTAKSLEEDEELALSLLWRRWYVSFSSMV
jgi:ATP-dependent RNA helicase DDX10/DBP4